MGVVGLNQACMVRELGGEFGYACGERTTSVLLCVPLHESNLLEKRVDSCGVRKEAFVEQAGIPPDEDVAEVEDDGGDIVSHVCRAILSEDNESGGIIARLQIHLETNLEPIDQP